MEERYKSKRFVDRLRWVIVDETGKVVNNNPSEDELKRLKKEPRYPFDSKEKYTKEQLKNELRRFEEKEGRIPTAADFSNNPGYPHFNTYRQRFGSWNNALIFAGLDINSYTDEQLLNYPIQFYEEYGRPPVAADFINDPRYPGTNTYLRHFGSWSNALKLVELDVDSMVKNGTLETSSQKARFAETIVIDHFKEHPIDLAGKNCNNPCDGVCPNGKTYDVKSSKFYKKGYWSFGTNNKYKKEIEIYYFLAFNEDWTRLRYGWRVPGEIAGKDNFYIGLNPSYEFDLEDMEDYDITDKLRDILGKYGLKY